MKKKFNTCKALKNCAMEKTTSAVMLWASNTHESMAKKSVDRSVITIVLQNNIPFQNVQILTLIELLNTYLVLMALMYAVIRIFLISSRRISDTMLANGFSQAYIFITWMPRIISFITPTRLSVIMATLSRSIDNKWPRPVWTGTVFSSRPTTQIIAP